MIHRLLLLSALALVLSLCACSDDDDPVAPPDPGADGVIHIPDEVATLAEAIAAAADGDSLFIAAGTYDGNVTVDKAVSISGTSQTDDWTILDTTDGPLHLVADFRDIKVRSLKATGGETAIAIDLHWGDVDLSNCEVIGATHGVTVEADTGTVAMNGIIFRDNGTDLGNGSGLRVWGNGSVALTNGIFLNIDGGSGVAVTASDESAVHLKWSSISNHDAGNAAVVACTGMAAVLIDSTRFRNCAGTLVHGSGESLGLVRVEFEECAGTMVRIESNHPQHFLHTLSTRQTQGTVLSVGDGQTVQVWSCLFDDHDGTVIDLGDDVALDLRNDTAVDLTGPLVAAGANCTVDMLRSVVVDASTPVISSGTPAITECDFWRTDGANAWAGLEEFLGVDGNVEADPLFCDRGNSDYRVEIGSPCSLGMGEFMGAFMVGCE